jgi:4-amino-4-deoxy-L-arabinose transferase-like glycosyltransferase
VKRQNAELLALALVSIGIRLIYMSPYPGGWDDIDFALALDRFDLSAMQPHFPGYPVYILVAHLFYYAAGEPFSALSMLSAVAGGLTVVPLWMLFTRLGSMSAGRLAAILYAVGPLPIVTGIQPTSDALGTLLAALLALLIWRSMQQEPAAGMNRRRSFILAGLVLGLLLGVRVSYVPLAVLWAGAAAAILYDRGIPRRQALRNVLLSAAAAALVCAAWAGALAVSEGGFAPLMKLAFSFTEGHFTDWGGAYSADSSFFDRARYFLLRQIGAAGMGTLWPGYFGWRWLPSLFAAFGAIGLIYALLARILRKAQVSLTRRAIFLILWIVPYLLWAFFAQNVDKPRHILPLIPPLLWLLATGLEHFCSYVSQVLRRPLSRKALYVCLSLLWLAGTAAVTYPLAREAHDVKPPVLRLAEYVKASVPKEDSIMFTWEEQRVISYISPEHQVKRLRHWNDMRTELMQYPEPPRHIFATNAFIQGIDRSVGSWFNEIAAFEGSPWLYPTYHRVVLYEQKPGFIEGLR